METDLIKDIPLEISIDYPVHWRIQRILRDLEQNFFDSMPATEFDSRFHLRTKQDAFIMESDACSFSYEWLIPIGGSTKTDHPGKYIGQYGEGFKICMICLLRENPDCTIIMESRNWQIIPYVYPVELDEKQMHMLGYHLYSRDDDGQTHLTLTNMPWTSSELYQIAKEVQLEFFYPANPLFGELLFDEEKICIYGRSNMPIPDKDRDPEFRGILYINSLARGRLPFPCNILIRTDMMDKDSRKREVLKGYQVPRFVYWGAKKMNAADSVKLLRILSPKWNSMPEKPIDIFTWYYLICQLVRNISSDEDVARSWMEEHRDLAYIERPGTDREKKKLIQHVWDWHHTRKDKRKLVNPIFRLLGAQNIVEEYHSYRAKSFEAPTQKETEGIDLIYDALEELSFPAFTKKPELLLIRDGTCHPLEFSIRNMEKSDSEYKMNYLITKIALLHEDFAKGRYKHTLLKVSEILLNAYGSPKSAKHNALLTFLGGHLIKNTDRIAALEERWDKLYA